MVGAPPRRGPLYAGAALLFGAVVTSGALSFKHLGGGPLYGCGLESACDQALASDYARLPGLGWPVAFLGLAHFTACLAAWLVGRARLTSAVALGVRAGALASAFFAFVMLKEDLLCPWCLAGHLCNLVFWGLAESAGHFTGARGRASAGAYAAGFILVTGVLALFSAAGAGSRPEGAVVADEGFSGRYRRGPANAPVRLVVFNDYQCEDCREIEAELDRVLSQRDDVSLSNKHFPLSSDCNPKARELGKNPHPNACRAARAAEAAGMLQGDSGFYRMHAWLFDRDGHFTDPELSAALPGLGFDPSSFLLAMRSPEAASRVRADIDEALSLGLHVTPMIFVNGREFRGWNRPGALTRTIEEVAAAVARGAAQVAQPPPAFDKFLEDWRQQPRREVPPAARGRVSAGARVEVVLWGDYLEPNTRELDRRLRAAVAARAGVVYSYRQFPVERECNPVAARTLHPGACLAARAAEAAFQMGGQGAFEALHAWLMQRSTRAGLEEVVSAAEGMGLPREAFREKVLSAEVEAVVRADVAAAQQLGVHSIPLLFIDGRWVPRWKLEGERVPEAMIAEAVGR